MMGGDSMSINDLFIMILDIVATDNISVIIAFWAVLICFTFAFKER